MRLEAQWTPKDPNQEADRLSNLDTKGFNPELEIKLELKDQPWIVLQELLRAGEKFQEAKERDEAVRLEEQVRRRKEDKLRNREKW